MFGKTKEELENDAAEVQEQLNKYTLEEKKIADEKTRKKNLRTKLENLWKTNNQVYDCGKPVQTRFVLLLRQTATNPKAFEPQVIETYGLKELFDFLNKNAKKPVSPPKFSDTDDLVSD